MEKISNKIKTSKSNFWLRRYTKPCGSNTRDTLTCYHTRKCTDQSVFGLNYCSILETNLLTVIRSESSVFCLKSGTLMLVRLRNRPQFSRDISATLITHRKQFAAYCSLNLWLAIPKQLANLSGKGGITKACTQVFCGSLNWLKNQFGVIITRALCCYLAQVCSKKNSRSVPIKRFPAQLLGRKQKSLVLNPLRSNSFSFYRSINFI